ncbi:MAG: MBL fold metallo-hydrolase, partial [Actinomycetota bacterium]|nr:MBL fold metallo-hydrolase [Actinomycetota bacterium]
MDVVDEYTGHVEPGGPAARRTLDALTITKISVGPMDNNAYLLVCR